MLGAERAAAEFHARHAAKAKTYEYRIFRGEICPPWTARFAWALNWPLDMERMRAAAAIVMGAHDFTSFAASDPDATMRRAEEACEEVEKVGNVRTIFESDWREEGELLIYRVRETVFCTTWYGIWWGRWWTWGGGRGRRRRWREFWRPDRGVRRQPPHQREDCFWTAWSIESERRDGRLRSGQLRDGRLRSGQLRSGRLRSGQLRSGRLRSGRLRGGQLRDGRLRSGQH